MSDIETTTVSEEGFASTSQVDDFELTVDATNETGPNPNEVLVADYASCFLPALRVGGQQRDYDDLGQIEIDAEAALDDEEDLDAISFTIRVEADVPDDELDEIASRAEDICHVHSALDSDLHADVSAEADAF